MLTEKIKNAAAAADGTELSVMERPEGLGTFDDYHRFVQECRKKYPEAFARLPSLDEYLKERREEAAREWRD